MDWETPNTTISAVKVELFLTIPKSGLAGDVEARAAALLLDSTGQVIKTRHIDTTTGVKALLTTAQKVALADIMTSLHSIAKAKFNLI